MEAVNDLGECDCEAREDCPTEWPEESDRALPCECACHGLPAQGGRLPFTPAPDPGESPTWDWWNY